MTEAEWQACTDPRRMQEFLGKGASLRKWQLFCCSAARGKLPLASGLPDAEARQLILFWEDIVDRGPVTHAHYEQYEALDQARQRLLRDYPPDGEEHRAIGQMFGLLAMCPEPNSHPITWSLRHEWRDEAARWAAFLRDIFGPLPFRAVALEPAWQTTAAAGVAQAIHTDYAFDRLPILADALEDAGCASREILDHCRGPGPHVRGCWVVDQVLGKK